MTAFTESVVEQAALAWFENLGYTVKAGPDIAPDGSTPERGTYTEVILHDRLRQALRGAAEPERQSDSGRRDRCVPPWFPSGQDGSRRYQVVAIVDDKREAIGALCRKYRVVRLFVFGSALRDDFRPGRSDIDLLVEFGPMSGHDKAHAYFNLLDELSELLGAHVDLVMTGAVKNRYIARDIAVLADVDLPTYQQQRATRSAVEREFILAARPSAASGGWGPTSPTASPIRAWLSGSATCWPTITPPSTTRPYWVSRPTICRCCAASARSC